MKKLLISLGLIISALTLTNCTKKAVEPQAPETPKANYSFYADFELTKTDANVAGKTSWVVNDEMNVFFGDGTYQNCGKFTCVDAETGRFEGSLTEEQQTLLAETNDWYFVYPYHSSRVSPASTDKGYNEVGCKKGVSMTQVNVNDMSHLDGNNLPLYAVCKDVAKGTSPNPTMKQIASVLEIVVSNSNDTDINVSNIEFSTTNYNVAGTYYLNIVSDPIVLTSSGESYVGKSASLNVTNGTIEPGKSAKFYLPITPFEVEGSPETISLKVTCTAGIVTKAISAPVGTSFASGHIKTLKFAYTIPAVERVSEGDYAILAKKDDNYYILTNVPNVSKSKNRLTSENFTYNNETSLFLNEDKYIWKISDDGSNYYIQDKTNKYISWSSDNTADLQESAYSLSITKDGEVYHINSVNDSERILSKNTSSDFFAFYGNTGQYTDLLLIPVVPDTRTPLDAVTNLMADKVAETPNSLEVVWDAVAEAASYTVSLTPEGAEAQTVTETSCTFTGLAYNTEYTISVVANPTNAETHKASDPVTTTATTGDAPAGAASYVKVNSDLVDWSGTYLIVADNKAANGTITSSWLKYEDVTIVDSIITDSPSITNCVVIITKEADDNYSIKFKNTNKYLGTTDSNSGIKVGESYISDFKWKFSFSSGLVTIENIVKTGRHLRINGASGFRTYTGTTGTQATLFKLSE